MHVGCQPELDDFLLRCRSAIIATRRFVSYRQRYLNIFRPAVSSIPVFLKK